MTNPPNQHHSPPRESEDSDSPARESKSVQRTVDERRTGHGSQSALSRLKVVERRRAEDKVSRGREEQK